MYFGPQIESNTFCVPSRSHKNVALAQRHRTRKPRPLKRHGRCGAVGVDAAAAVAGFKVWVGWGRIKIPFEIRTARFRTGAGRPSFSDPGAERHSDPGGRVHWGFLWTVRGRAGNGTPNFRRHQFTLIAGLKGSMKNEALTHAKPFFREKSRISGQKCGFLGPLRRWPKASCQHRPPGGWATIGQGSGNGRRVHHDANGGGLHTGGHPAALHPGVGRRSGRRPGGAFDGFLRLEAPAGQVFAH